MFVLHSIINIYLSKKKRLYCAFIDYKKAFDLIGRSYIWYKMIKIGINGKSVTTIYGNVYGGAKSCISNTGAISESFTRSAGVRQGENISPRLFVIYLNDFEFHISRTHVYIRV